VEWGSDQMEEAMAIEWVRPAPTLEEFMALQDPVEGDVRGYEYEDGWLMPLLPLYLPESGAWGDLLGAVGHHVKQNDLGRVWLDVILYLDPEGRRRYFPDIVYLAKDRLHQRQGKIIVGPPSLVVEVTTEDSQERDREAKMSAYHAAGVPWYWIADVVTREIEEYRWAETGYELASRVPFEGPSTPQLFPGLAISGIDS
jgi:Uma2 family endonuclease